MPLSGRRVFSFLALFIAAAVSPCLLWAATATAVIPAAAPHGARVVISGTALDAPDVGVTFSSPGGAPLPAAIAAREPRLLEIIVPGGTATGPLIVRNGVGTIATLSFTLLPEAAFTTVATLAASYKAHDLLKAPAAVALTPSGVVYIADPGHDQVKLISPSGEVSPVASGFKEPAGLAFDPVRLRSRRPCRQTHCRRNGDAACRNRRPRRR
jgi:hypothetical protein